MAKPLPLFIGVLGVGATATGGILLMGKKGSGEGTGTSATGSTTQMNEGTPGPTASTPQPGDTGQTGRTGTEGGNAQGGQSSQQAQNLIFDGIDAFKGSPTKSDCLMTDFQGLSLAGDIGGELSNSPPTSDTFFKTDGDNSTKSCLIINWKKSHDSSKKKWSGKFTWLWTFQKGEEGFITFNVMEPSASEGKVKFTGVFYLVEKAEAGDTWSVNIKKEVTTTSTEVDKNSLDDYFPKVGTGLKNANSELGDYWGLIEDKSKLEDLCKNAESCKDQVEVKKLHWTSSTSADKTLKDWTSGFTWWEKIYEEAKDHWNLSEQIQNFKGKWVLQSTPS